MSIFKFFSLALVLICIHQIGSTAGTVFYIANTTDACGNTNGRISCLTLSQFAANVRSDSNITFILLEGNHSLDQNLTISYVDNFTIHPNSSMAVINCGGSGLLQFFSTQNIYISNVSFIRCRMNVTYNVSSGGLIISNSLFEGQGITGTALVLNNVVHAEIDSCMFISNKAGTDIGRTLPPYDGIRSTVGGAIFFYLQ